jgi:hypothetical protein
MIHVGLGHQQAEVLAAKRGENFRQAFGQRRRDSLERLVKQQAFGPDRQRTPQRDQLPLAAAEQERLSMPEFREFADRVVDQLEACLAVKMICDGCCA